MKYFLQHLNLVIRTVHLHILQESCFVIICVNDLIHGHNQQIQSCKEELVGSVFSFCSRKITPLPLSLGLYQNKEEVMAVRLREADNMAAMAELQQQISELEIQVKCKITTPLIG